jgi:membrane protease YdiL (CAAX protease family)
VDRASSLPPPGEAGAAGPGPEPARIRWGIGDFVWIYVAGLFASVIGASVGFAITGDTADHVGALTMGLSLAGQFGTWFAGVVYVARLKGRSFRSDFGAVVHVRDAWVVAVGVALSIAGEALIRPLLWISGEEQQVVNDLNSAHGAKFVVIAVTAVVLAPVCEELLFRGLLLRSLRRRMSPEWAVVVQALVFALAHPMLSPTIGDLAAVPALFLFGAVSGVLAVRRGDLSRSVLLHVGFNLVATLFAL